MSKKRVYDLAKEYGMTGQQLAAKLRDLGFPVKSHMTALDDFEVIEIQGRLEAYGLVEQQKKAAPGETTMGGLVVKRKKKKATPADEEAYAAEDAEDAEEEREETAVAAVEAPAARQAPAAAPEATPTPAAPAAETQPEAQPLAAAEAPSEPAAPSAPTHTEQVAAEAVEIARETPEPTVAPARAEQPALAADAAPTPAPTAPAARAEQPPAAAEQPAEAEPAAAAARSDGGAAGTEAAREIERPETERARAARPAAEAPAARKGKKSAATRRETADASSEDVVRPSAKRRPGKVVGFIDLSKLQANQPRKAESRRLRSSDDETAPDVKPTLARNRKSAFVRGDHASRGQLTAQQLREREAGRFLRRNKLPGGGGGGGGRRGGPGFSTGRGRRSAPSGSPHSGQTVTIEEPIPIKKLAEALSVTVGDMIGAGIRLGSRFHINTLLDNETAELLAAEFDVKLSIKRVIEAEEALLTEIEEKRASVGEEKLVSRPPTVAVLGHVDHGKTTLIDTIRRSRITTGEAGGITQHIGAYQVTTKKGHTLTILDTPGHAAFTAMRKRGANAVDVVVLIVAADDGVKPQTKEAIQHARSAGVPIVVALNKIDRPEANPDRVKQQLAAEGLNPREWGGETEIKAISALKGDGIEDLLEHVFLEGEMLELRCHPEGPAKGVVLEAEIQQGKGKVAHLLVQDGSLERGQVILAGDGYGKVRSIHDDRGKQINSAGPSMPVEVTGFNELPAVGDNFLVVESLDRAKEVAEERNRKNRQISQVERQVVSRENLLEAVAAQGRASINLLVKADVSGSVEVLKEQLSSMIHEEVEVRLVGASVGQVGESDVDHAITTDATILAFHVSTATKARQAAERAGVEIRNYSVIYELLDDVRKMMEGSLAPEVVEVVTGHIEIRRIFKSSRLGNIAGCYVLDGTVHRDNRVRLLRDGAIVYTGSLASLKREKDDAKEVREGFECGVVLKDYNDIKEGDVLETYKLSEVKRELEIPTST